MKTEKITSNENSKIKHVKKLLKSKSYRYENGEYAIEGLRVLDDVKKTKEIFVCEGLDIPQILTNRINIVKKDIFETISSTENSQGVVAICELKINASSRIDKNARYVLLDRLQDPGNMGTIIRTASAFGLKGIITVPGCVDVFSPKVVRSAVSAIEKIDVIMLDDIDILKDCNVIASGIGGKDVSKFSWPKGFVLVIGNEGHGISEKLDLISEQKVSISITENMESLNAAVAAGILLYDAASKEAI
ncbi:TrmH family RNA methyltransferase [Elusimicrobiota bacterium]